MLIYIKSNLFESPAQTLVNTVNTVGVMGKGVAKKFKKEFPDMFREYKLLCDQKKISIGNLHLWRGGNKWVLNFPTKTIWQMPSKLDYIEKGLKKFVDTYEDLGITSISFPPLGCGNGQLEWPAVKKVMEKYLGRLPIKIFIHDIQVEEDFIPEHLEKKQGVIPSNIKAFFEDIERVVHRNKGTFDTLTGSSNFRADLVKESGILRIEKSIGAPQIIPKAALVSAWSTLQDGILSGDQFNEDSPSRYKSYLFPILSELPYVITTQAYDSKNHHPKTVLLVNFKNSLDSRQNELW